MHSYSNLQRWQEEKTLLREEIRRLAEWYGHEISRIANKTLEIQNDLKDDRQRRGEMVLLTSKRLMLEGCLAHFQSQGGSV